MNFMSFYFSLLFSGLSLKSGDFCPCNQVEDCFATGPPRPKDGKTHQTPWSPQKYLKWGIMALESIALSLFSLKCCLPSAHIGHFLTFQRNGSSSKLKRTLSSSTTQYLHNNSLSSVMISNYRLRLVNNNIPLVRPQPQEGYSLKLLPVIIVVHRSISQRNLKAIKLIKLNNLSKLFMDVGGTL